MKERTYFHTAEILLLAACLLAACAPVQPAASPPTAEPHIEPSPSVPPQEETHPSQEVSGWLGYIISPVEDSDDALILIPEGSGEVGLTGATPELEAQIIALRNADPPGKEAHFWGTLLEGAADHNGYQLMVTRIRVGATATEAEPFEGWVGKLSNSTFNGGRSFVFTLDGMFPMQFSAHSGDSNLLDSLAKEADCGSRVRLSGELLTGIPDVNGSRLQVSSLEVLEPGTGAPAPPAEAFDPQADWLTFTNEQYGYSFRYPQNAVLTTQGPLSFPTEELPAGMTADAYLAQLQEQYGSQVCVQVEYLLGVLYIGAPLDEAGKYTPCTVTGIGDGQLTQKTEMLTINGKPYSASGYEMQRNSDTLTDHNEFLLLTLENGLRLTYGSANRADASFADYQMKGAPQIRSILSTLNWAD